MVRKRMADDGKKSNSNYASRFWEKSIAGLQGKEIDLKRSSCCGLLPSKQSPEKRKGRLIGGTDGMKAGRIRRR